MPVEIRVLEGDTGDEVDEIDSCPRAIPTGYPNSQSV